MADDSRDIQMQKAVYGSLRTASGTIIPRYGMKKALRKNSLFLRIQKKEKHSKACYNDVQSDFKPDWQITS
jgi:hypothetical protein